MRSLKIAAVLSVGTMALIAAARAQTQAAQGGTIDWTPIIVAAINALFPVIAAVATYIINDKIKNQQLATQLSNAIQNGLGAIQQQATSVVVSNKVRTEVKNKAVAIGVQYVLDNAQEAITHFKIPTDRIAQELEAKLGLAEIATNVATSGSSNPTVMVNPMDRVLETSSPHLFRVI